MIVMMPWGKDFVSPCRSVLMSPTHQLDVVFFHVEEVAGPFEEMVVWPPVRDHSEHHPKQTNHDRRQKDPQRESTIIIKPSVG